MRATIMHCDLPKTNWHAEMLRSFTYKHLPDFGIDYNLLFHGEGFPEYSEIDLVEFSEWCNPWHEKVARACSLPIVCSTEEGSLESLKSYLVGNKINTSFMLSKISHFIARSSWTRDMLVRFGINSSKISIIHYGADLDAFKPGNREPEESSFLYVGSINRQKGVHHLLCAYKKIMDRIDWKLRLCVGEFNNDEGLLGDMEKLARKTDRIELIPFPPMFRLPEVYQASTCFCLIQDYSTPVLFSFASVWAIASGMPIISLNTGALRDYIIPGENGFLCRDADDVAKKMLDITMMDWKKMGKVSREIAENNHHPWRVAAKYRAVYGCVLECPA